MKFLRRFAAAATPALEGAVAVASHVSSTVDTAKLQEVVVSAVLQGHGGKGILSAVLAAAPALFVHPEYAALLKGVIDAVEAAQAIHAKATAAA